MSNQGQEKTALKYVRIKLILDFVVETQSHLLIITNGSRVFNDALMAYYQ